MRPERKVSFDIANKTIVRVILWIAAAVVAYNSIGRISHILKLIFISFFLCLAINPVVSSMSKRLKIESRARASAVSYLLIVVVVAGFFALITPPLVQQGRDFIRDVPSLVSDFQSQNSSLARAAKRYKIDQRLDDAAKSLSSHYSNFGATILDTTKRVISALVSVLVVIVLTFMMLVEGPKWFELIIGNVPLAKQVAYRRLAHRMYRTVSGFVLGQVILALVAATACFTALEISSHLVGVSINALALAGIVALFGLIPMIGNPISSLTVILVCLLNSVPLAIIMLIYFVVYYQVESLTLAPYIQARQNELTPLLVFISALLGISLAGIIGAFAAIPVAGCIRILLEDHFEQRNKALREAI